MQQADLFATATVSVGDTLAGHRIRSVLGRGGMGQVFLADHPRAGRCAMKVASAERRSGGSCTDVRREASLLAAARHPAVAHPLGSGLAVTASGESVTWMTMRQVPGIDLTRSGRLTTGEVLDVAQWIAGALDHVHAAGIIHCDVKAANIMIERDRMGRVHHAVLVDFGIARQRHLRHAALDPAFVGTLTTAPPEALRGDQCSPASDQYGLACTVYGLLAGVPPFLDDGTLHSALAARAAHSPIPLESIDPALAEFDAVLRRALAPEPNDRFAHCRDFAATLRSCASSRLWVSPTPTSVDEPAQLRLPATLIPQ